MTDALDATHATIDLLKSHASVRKFVPEPVDPTDLQAILDAGRQAATWKAFQSYSIIVVEDPDVLAGIYQCAPQPSVKSCRTFLLFVGDLSRAATAVGMHNEPFHPTGVESLLISAVDAALALQNTVIAAESLGYAGVQIGTIRHKSAEVSALLGLPDYVYPIVGLCLGKPDPSVEPRPTPRLPHDVVVHRDRYQPATAEALRAYDATLSAHFANPDHCWSERMVAQWGVPEVTASTENLRDKQLL
ncbi:MAG: nitroreductase family protein [Cellulomonadaceae bacterium]|nr:nitroreductase family protein [Cellulomonadaceae bacterium]